MSLFLDMKTGAKEAGVSLRWFRQRMEREGVRVHDFKNGKQKRYKMLRSEFEQWKKARVHA